MIDYATHIEGLRRLHDDLTSLYPQHQAHLTAAIELMRAAQPKDAEAEQKHCVRQLREHRHRDEAGRIQGLMDERAAARAEGFEAMEAACRFNEEQLAAARAESERLRAEVADIPAMLRIVRHQEQTRLTNLRTAAERVACESRGGEVSIPTMFRLRAAIEASKWASK